MSGLKGLVGYMKKYKAIKSSFLYRLGICFVIMILIPILCTWWIYEKILNLYYLENALAAQQINLQNSTAFLDSSLDAVTNLFVTLENNRDIIYYSEYKDHKSKMFYADYMGVKDFCEALYITTPYLKQINIYSASPLYIYASPFVYLSERDWNESLEQKIEAASFNEIVWHIAESGQEGEAPELFAYKKLYSTSYLKCVGYIEIQLSSEMFQEYFDLLKELTGKEQASLALYSGDKLIYSAVTQEMNPVFEEPKEFGYEILKNADQYKHHLNIPELDMWVVYTGRLSDVNIMPSEHMPSIGFTVIFLLLLVLFVMFFGVIVTLSKRILDFSSYIRHANPEKLTPFRPRYRKEDKKDELDGLIDTYNNLIRENNSLISSMRKMELIAQEARLQALQGQIHPHFIFGTLETIRMIALQNKDKMAADMVFSLSSLIRYSMSISSKSVTLKDEIAIGRHYLKIQKMRFDERFTYLFDVDEKLLDMKLPPFILQPILENAIVYGVSKSMDLCEIKVNVHEKENMVVMEVANSGATVDLERMNEVNDMLLGKLAIELFKGNSNGVALNNIRERLTLYFNGSVSMRMELKEGWTAVVISFTKQ